MELSKWKIDPYHNILFNHASIRLLINSPVISPACLNSDNEKYNEKSDVSFLATVYVNWFILKSTEVVISSTYFPISDICMYVYM